MKGKIRYLLIVFALISYETFAQNNWLKFNLVEGPGGMSLGGIRNMSQDRYGYMWFSAQVGKCVYRYDGYRYTIFKHDDQNPNTLGGVDVHSVSADNTGMIWIVFGDRIDKYDPVSGVFTHYIHNPNDPASLSEGPSMAPIVKDHRGRVWIGTYHGADCLDEKTGKFTHYRNDPKNPKSLSSDVVWYIYEDRQGTIWMATGDPWFNESPNNGGLNRFNEDGTFTRYLHDSTDPHSLINNKVGAILEDSKGNFWVGTGGDGLHLMDRKTGKFERLPYNPKKTDGLSRPALKPGEVNDKINFIIEDTVGAIWIGTEYSGMNRYDPASGKVSHYFNSNGYPDSTTWNAYVSRDGVLWITSEDDHLFRLDPFHKRVDSIFTAGVTPMNFLEDRNGFLWVGTLGQGLLKFDSNKKFLRQFKHDSSDPKSLMNVHVPFIFQFGDSVILVGGSQLLLLNTFTDKISLFSEKEFNKDSIPGGAANILQDKSGKFWFGSWGSGLTLYDPLHHKTRHFSANDKDSTTICCNQIIGIHEDRSGMIWIHGPGGISRLDQQNYRFTRYPNGTWTNSIYQDSRGDIWAGTAGGLYHYDPGKDEFSRFFEPESGISHLTIGGIAEDDAKNLWLGSEEGMIRVNPVNGDLFIYKNRYQFYPTNWARMGMGKDGKIYVPGGDCCLYYFSPKDLAVQPDFKVILTDFSINTFHIRPGEKSPLKVPVEEVSEISLDHDQNNISFNFAAIDYRDPASIKYFYKLDGFNKDWVEVSDKTEKSSFYFNLPQGKYVYHVKAYNTEGSKAERIVNIRVNPPWWQTWWAYASYAVFLILGVWGYIRWRTKTLKEEKIVLEEKVTKRTRELKEEKEIVERTLSELKITQAQLVQSEKMASMGELTAGIAHEIQNPLNFVNNFSEINSELLDELQSELQNANPEEAMNVAKNIADNEKKIAFHGKRADSIVKAMLLHSRTSTGQKEATDINKLADEYLRLAYHGMRAKDKMFNAAMKTDFDLSVGKINIVPQDIGRVLLNIYNNAFYAVFEKDKRSGKGYEPTLEITTKKKGKKVEISVRDNGDGIPQQTLAKIFQPFFTTKPTGQGTGLGLSLSYDIITKGHGGELNVRTGEGNFTEFTISLPAE
jgi:signal transduction histidine kinase/ligand-binding sensor domain-containing protein